MATENDSDRGAADAEAKEGAGARPAGGGVPFPRTVREALRQFFGDGASAHPLVQFLKYGFVGGLATAVNVVAVFLFCWKAFHCITPDDPFVRLFGLETAPVDEAARARLTNWAYVCAFPIANTFCYVLNRLFVFVPGRHGALREFVEFFAASAAALGAGMAAAWILIRGFGAWTSVGIFANLVSAIAINYALRKFVVFKG